MRITLPEHPVPAGPLGVRWHAYDLPQLRAGVALPCVVELENVGSVTWRRDVWLSYHWLDLLGNPLVWEGQRAELPHGLAPGSRAEVTLPVQAPVPPGRYRLSIDLVEEGRFWFAEVGNTTVDVDLEIPGRLLDRRLAVVVAPGPEELAERTRAALAGQEVPIAEEGGATAFLAAGCVPHPDWSTRILAAHDEGYAWVGGSVELLGSRRDRRRVAEPLEPWTPGFGRMPTWRHPLVCPSIVREFVDHVTWSEPVGGLPTMEPRQFGEPWLMDGTIELGYDARAALRAGRRPA